MPFPLKPTKKTCRRASERRASRRQSAFNHVQGRAVSAPVSPQGPGVCDFTCEGLSSPAGFRYVTCQIHNCSAKMLTAPFSGPIDHGSLAVQDDFIFFKVRLLLGPLEIGAQGEVA